jgi:peroxiredoxin
MRPFALLLLLSIFSGPALQAQTDTDSLRIEVFLEGLPTGKARLVGTMGDQNYLADSATVDASGHFVLQRAKPLPAGFYYFLLPGQKNFSFLMDRHDQRITFRGKAADIPGTLRNEGSLNTRLFYEIQRFQAAQEPELASLAETLRKTVPGAPEYQQAKARQTQLLAERKAQLDDLVRRHPDAFYVKFKLAGQNPDWVEFRKPNGDIDTMRQVMHYRARFWDNVDFSDQRLLFTPVVGNKLRRYIKELTPQQPDSLIKVADELVRRVLPHKPYFQFFVNWIALQYENGKTKVMDGEAVYVHLINQFFTPELAFWTSKEEVEKLRKHAWEMEASLLGRKGPDVKAQTLDGQTKSIYEITAPLVVVFMFSPDCDHCQKEAPKVQQIYEKWKSRGVEVFGIGVNTTAPELQTFLQKEKFSFPTVFDPTNRAIYAKYFVDNTPELYVLNKDRTIVAKNLVAEQLEVIFERELRKIR